MRVRAIEHHEVAISRALAHVLFDLLDGVTRFGTLRLGAVDRDRLALGAVGEELLLRARRVVGDQLVGHVEDRLRAAIILFELEDLRAGEVFFEAQDVFVIAAAPRIDRLVVVADDGQVAVLLGQDRAEAVLGEVDVLVLVDQDVAEFVLIARAHVAVGFEQPDRLTDQVVEVETVALAQTPVVLVVDLGDALGHERGGAGFVFGRRQQLILGLRDLVEGRAGRDLALVIVEVVQHVAHDRTLVGVVHDREVARDADLGAVAAQHSDANRVEGADPEVAGLRADEALQAGLHLGGGLVGEGDRKDAIREDLLLAEQVGDPVGQYPGLAAACACENENRPVGMLDGIPLDRTKNVGFCDHHLTMFAIGGLCASEPADVNVRCVKPLSPVGPLRERRRGRPGSIRRPCCG